MSFAIVVSVIVMTAPDVNPERTLALVTSKDSVHIKPLAPSPDAVVSGPRRLPAEWVVVIASNSALVPLTAVALAPIVTGTVVFP